jgi:hypothetical protein
MKKETENISRRKFLNSAVMATAGAAAIGSLAYEPPVAHAAPAFIRRRQATEEPVSFLDEIQERGTCNLNPRCTAIDGGSPPAMM